MFTGNGVELRGSFETMSDISIKKPKRSLRTKRSSEDDEKSDEEIVVGSVSVVLLSIFIATVVLMFI